MVGRTNTFIPTRRWIRAYGLGTLVACIVLSYYAVAPPPSLAAGRVNIENGRAPVVHAGRYHVLSCGPTSVVLDAHRGMTIAALGGNPDNSLIPAGRASIGNGGVRISCTSRGRQRVRSSMQVTLERVRSCTGSLKHQLLRPIHQP